MKRHPWDSFALDIRLNIIIRLPWRPIHRILDVSTHRQWRVMVAKNLFNELGHLSLRDVSILVIVEFIEKLIKLFYIIIFSSFLVNAQSYFFQKVFSFNFVEISIFIIVMILPNIVQRFIESCIIVDEIER